MRIALFEPEIPQNTGTILRLAACMKLEVDLIGPYGFVWSDQRLKRAGMDYLSLVSVTHYTSWKEFYEKHQHSENRLILVDVKGTQIYTRFSFQSRDTLLFGKESSGVPEDVLHQADTVVRIPISPHQRSLNVAVSVAMVVGEALRQTDMFLN